MFVVATTERVKRVAKDLQKEMKKLGIKIEWSKSLDIVSRMYEYKGWTDVTRQKPGAVESPDDAACDAKEVARRKKHHVDVLVSLGLTGEQALNVVETIKPTSRRKSRTEADLPPELRAIADMARQCADAGLWERAEAFATHGLQRAIMADKAPFIRILEEATPHSAEALFNLGMAYLNGDAGKRDVPRARKLIEECEKRGLEPENMAVVYKVLGDIAAGHHGTPPDLDLALEYWEIAAVVHGSAAAAFNIGLVLQTQGFYDEAAEYYGKASDQGYAPAMTNLAGMILDADIKGTPDQMEGLYRRAAVLGDHLAARALPQMAMLRLAMERAKQASQARFEYAEEALRTSAGYDQKVWFAILRDFGWQIGNLKPRAEGEGAQVCVATSSDGRSFPVFMSAASYAYGDNDDPIMKKMRKQLDRWPDAVLIFNASGIATTGSNRKKAAMCLGSIKVQGVWTDLFLREGGLDEALRQHRLLLDTPSLNVVSEFWTPSAAEVAAKVADSRFKRISGMLGGSWAT